MSLGYGSESNGSSVIFDRSEYSILTETAFCRLNGKLQIAIAERQSWQGSSSLHQPVIDSRYAQVKFSTIGRQRSLNCSGWARTA